MNKQHSPGVSRSSGLTIRDLVLDLGAHSTVQIRRRTENYTYTARNVFFFFSIITVFLIWCYLLIWCTEGDTYCSRPSITSRSQPRPNFCLQWRQTTGTDEGHRRSAMRRLSCTSRQKRNPPRARVSFSKQ